MRSWLRSLIALVGLLSLAGCLPAVAQVGCVPNPNLSPLPFVDGCPLPAAGLNTAFGLFPQVAASTAALRALPITTGAIVMRQDFSVGFGAPSALYQSSAAACPQGDDGGACIAASGGGSWVLAPQSVYDIRLWGLPNNSIQFYADSVGGNDFAGASFCVISTAKCKTLNQALVSAAKFCAANGAMQINLAAGVYAPFSVVGQTSCGISSSTGSFGGGALPLKIIGAGSATTTITDPCTVSCLFSVITLSQTANLQIGAVTVQASGFENGVSLVGVGDVFSTSGADVVFAGPAMGGAASAIHAEGTERILHAVGRNFSVTGIWSTIETADFGANISFGGNTTVTCTAPYTIQSEMFGLSSNSTLIFGNNGGGPITFPGCAGFPTFVAASGSRVIIKTTTINPTFPSTLIGKSSTDKDFPPCVGGNGGCNVVTAPTGFGAGATFSVTARSTAFGGQTQATAGTGAGTSGILWLSIPILLETNANAQTHCSAWIAGNTWPAGSTASVDSDTLVGGTNFRIAWQSNGVALTNGTIYPLNYMCTD